MKSYIQIGLSVLVATSLLSCKKKEESTDASSSIVPEMLPIVKESLPSTLESTSVQSLNVQSKSTDIHPLTDTNLTELKTRLFSPGPTDFQYRLKSIDDRLDSLADAIKECEATTTTTYTPPTVVSGMFNLQFSCVQVIDATNLGVSDFKVYFGKSGDFWYVGEFQTNADYSSSDTEPPSMANLAKIDANGNTIDLYQISVEKISGVDYSTVTHITADKSSGTFEVHTASSADATQVGSSGANYTGLGCGVSMRTNGSLIYASGQFSQISSCPSATTVCASGTDLTAATGCTGVVDNFAATSLARAGVSGSLGKALVIDRTNLPSL